MLMYNLLEYGDNHSKASENLWECWSDGPDNTIIDSESFKFKSKFTNKSNNEGNSHVEVAAPLKHLINFGELLNCH